MQRGAKKQPTRDDLAAVWKTIRDQSQIIKMQADKIPHLRAGDWPCFIDLPEKRGAAGELIGSSPVESF